MKRFSGIQIVITASMIAVVGVFAAYRYDCFPTGGGLKASMRLIGDALEEATRPLAEIDYALHYEATEKTFFVKSRDSSSEPSRIKDSDLRDFIQQLAPRPSKVAVIYKARDFPTTSLTADFEQRTRKVIEATGTKVLFLKSSGGQSPTE
ncbi:MAG: hypothetical protein KDK97_01050 [Verrucomicrobiales bacterium]|nr:hypothetical protein [Verrucomicrobiales bacterium]MCP5560620.1 hypothetical protein [Verrucomicrobiaceae bacterium]